MESVHRVTVHLKDCCEVGRVVVEKYRSDGAKGLTDDVPVAMLPSLESHWTSLGWEVVDERKPRHAPRASLDLEVQAG